MSALEPQLPHVHPEDLLRMSRQYYVETLPDGRQQFVSLRRSRSNGHSHHHGGHHHGGHHGHHHHNDLANVTKDEWNNLLERERNLKEANENLTRENQSLKTNLHSGDAELRRLQAWIPHLERDIQVLRAENQSLRRSLENAGEHASGHHRDVDKLRKKVNRLERENETLAARVRELTRQCQESVSDRVNELKAIIAAWKRRHEEAENRIVRLRRENADQGAIIEEQSERLTVYERILRRHGLLC